MKELSQRQKIIQVQRAVKKDLKIIENQMMKEITYQVNYRQKPDNWYLAEDKSFLKMVKNLYLKSALILALMLTSCAAEDKECLCDLEVTIDGNGSYTVLNVPTDCEGGYDRPPMVSDNHFIIGLKNCD
jgi:hypothetical protein